MSDVQTMSWQPPDNDQSFLRQDLKVTGWPVHRNGNEWRRRRACYGWNLIRSLPLPASSIPPSPSRLGSTAQCIVGQILPIYLQICLPARGVLETTICVSKSSSSLRLVLLPFWTRVGTTFTPWPSPNNMTGNRNAKSHTLSHFRNYL